MLFRSEVLAYIFALDTRIQKKYDNILRCLLSYFSWRRETRALDTLKTELNIPLGGGDIRNLIAVEIEKLAEKLEDGWEEDADNEAHGGKKSGKAEEEVASEGKEAEATEEPQEAEDLADKEENKKDSEEKEELPIKEEPREEAKKEVGEKTETAEPRQEEAEITATDKKEELAQKKNENFKKEDNVPDIESEPNTDKKEEAKSYNDAVDSPPLYEETVHDRPSDKISFIDEMVIDNMVKGDKSIIGYQRIDEAERLKGVNIHEDTVADPNEKNKSTDKEAYLYDKMIATDKGEAQQTLDAESTKQAEKAPETKNELPKETIQNHHNLQSNEQEFKPLSETLQEDLNESLENQVLKDLGNTMSDESREAFAQMQMDIAREKLSIAYAELGIDEPAEIIGMHEPAQESRENISPLRK